MESYDVECNEYENSSNLEADTHHFDEVGLRYVSDGPPLERATSTAGGYDLYAYSNRNGEVIGTGIYCEIPPGWVGMIVPRSSLGAKGFKLKNTVGVIDSDYRGEIKLAYEGFTPELGDRVAQLVIVPCWQGGATQMVSIDDLSTTARGAGGFGSTGT
jgi:dUTP pyrophosphatase